MKRKTSPALIAGVVAGLLVYVLGGYFLLISPQRKKSKDLMGQIASTQRQIDLNIELSNKAKNAPPIRVAELFRLTKAMPDDLDMAGLVLELSQIARGTGIAFDSITPQAAASVSGYQTVPIALEFEGTYYELSDFLFRLRNLVRVRSGRLLAQGRLFVVDSINFGESPRSYPRIKATLLVHAFVFGDAPLPGQPPAAAVTPTTTTGTDTTQTTTTATTSTETTQTTTQSGPNEPPATPASGASAAGDKP